MEAPGDGDEYIKRTAERAGEIGNSNVLNVFAQRRIMAKNDTKSVWIFLKETFFVAHLPKPLINDPKLEIVADDVFVEGNNKS